MTGCADVMCSRNPRVSATLVFTEHRKLPALVALERCEEASLATCPARRRGDALVAAACLRIFGLGPILKYS